MKKRKPLGEPFPLPLFCPTCFEPLSDENNMLFPTSQHETGVGCQLCWINPLCPGACNGVHGGPIPRGARRALRRYSVPGTWTCPTTNVNYAYTGPNTEEGWARHFNWDLDPAEAGTYLCPDATEWYLDEDEWHEDCGHDDYHRDDDYPEDDYVYRASRPRNPHWQSEFTYYHPVSEELSTSARPGYIPIPAFASRAA